MLNFNISKVAYSEDRRLARQKEKMLDCLVSIILYSHPSKNELQTLLSMILVIYFVKKDKHQASLISVYFLKNIKHILRANAQKNLAKSANRGHSSKPNLPSFSVCNKVFMSL